jgi:hypothetical protein
MNVKEFLNVPLGGGSMKIFMNSKNVGTYYFVPIADMNGETLELISGTYQIKFKNSSFANLQSLAVYEKFLPKEVFEDQKENIKDLIAKARAIHKAGKCWGEQHTTYLLGWCFENDSSNPITIKNARVVMFVFSGKGAARKISTAIKETLSLDEELDVKQSFTADPKHYPIFWEMDVDTIPDRKGVELKITVKSFADRIIPKAIKDYVIDGSLEVETVFPKGNELELPKLIFNLNPEEEFDDVTMGLDTASNIINSEYNRIFNDQDSVFEDDEEDYDDEETPEDVDDEEDYDDEETPEDVDDEDVQGEPVEPEERPRRRRE